MIKYRSLSSVIFLMVATLGLYGIFWFYWVSREMLAYNGRKGSPVLWVLALGLSGTIPFIYALPVWKFADLVHLTSKGRYNRFVFFAAGLFIVFIPVIVLLTQRLLNGIALEQMAQMDSGQMGQEQRDEARSGVERLDEGAHAGPGDEVPDYEPDDIRTIGR